MSSKEFNFYLKADLNEYEGKFVAIIGEKVVSFGFNAKSVLEEARKKFPRQRALLARIPREETLILNLKWK